jgi:hypothetical protein
VRRFALFASCDEVAECFQLANTPLLDTRYNIAMTLAVAAAQSFDGIAILRKKRRNIAR